MQQKPIAHYHLFDTAVLADPYPLYAEIRQAHPVYFDQDYGCWIVLQHRYVADLLRHSQSSVERLDSILPGHGIHTCLGALLARLEMKITLELLIELLPNITLDSQSLAQVKSDKVMFKGHQFISNLVFC